jgi:DNA repair photolyase
MRNVDYQERRARSALNRVHGMPFKWSLNPYQGCVHGCHYCYARRYHTYLNLNAGEDFSSKIFVKTNLPEVLRGELQRPSWRGEHVAIGTATDPYQPIEGRYELTRRCLGVLAEQRNSVGLVTKGIMVVRDLDLLQDLSERADCVVRFSFASLDERLWPQLEPGTSPPGQRLRAMERLAAAGIPVGILLAPILPGISDDPDDMEQVVRAAVDHGARFVDPAVLRLSPEVKDHFLSFLSSRFPGLLSRYRDWYAGTDAPYAFRARAERFVSELKARHQVPGRPPRRSASVRQLELGI